MQWKTHLAGGALAGAVAISASICKDYGFGGEPLYFLPLAMGCSLVGGLFPDIDLKTTKAGQAAKPASFLINALWGHRTLFHAPFLYAGAEYLFTGQMKSWAFLLFAFVAGAFSHILLDMLNPKGIPLFYPLPGNYHAMNMRQGGAGEKAVRLILYVLTACVLTRSAGILIL